MATFDIAASWDAATMNAIGSTVYSRVYPTVFTGKTTVDKDGTSVDVSWNVKSAPTFDLSNIPNGEALVRSHLLGLDAPPGVSKDAIRALLLSTLTGTTFLMNLPSFDLTVTDGGTSATVPASAQVYVQVSTATNAISFFPLKAVATTPNKLDQWLLNKVVIPQALQMARTLLSGIAIPPLSFAGASFGALAVTIVQDHVSVLANLDGKPPADPTGFVPPNGPVSILISGEVRQRVANTAATGFSKPMSTGGKIDLGVTTASYNASATLSHLSLNAGGNPVSYSFVASANGNANAGATVGCSEVGINYNIQALPAPTGTVAISINNTTLHARVSSLSTFVLLLSPTGNPVQWLLSALTAPLTQAIVAAFAPVISSALNGFGFDVVTIPSISFMIDRFVFTVTPSGLSLANGGGNYALVQGNVTLQ